MFYSQDGCRQDELLNKYVFRDFRNGTFVDVGAYDGIGASNTLFFEETLGWRGICLEPDPALFAALTRNRPNAKNLQVAAAAAAGERQFIQAGVLGGFGDVVDRDRITREGLQKGETSVTAMPLNDVLDEGGLSEVHYLSIDVEGAESEVLDGIDHNRFFVHVMTIECNDREEAKAFATRLAPHFRYAGYFGQDLFFVRRTGRFAKRAEALQNAIAPSWRSRLRLRTRLRALFNSRA